MQESVLLEGHRTVIQIARTFMEQPGYKVGSSFSGLPDGQVSGKPAGIFIKHKKLLSYHFH